MDANHKRNLKGQFNPASDKAFKRDVVIFSLIGGSIPLALAAFLVTAKIHGPDSLQKILFENPQAEETSEGGKAADRSRCAPDRFCIL